jgi:hypothetical protein
MLAEAIRYEAKRGEKLADKSDNAKGGDLRRWIG